MTDDDGKKPARAPRKKPSRPNGQVWLGLLLIALGKQEGFAQFGATGEAYLASLAPLLGFVIVLSLLLALSGHFLAAGISFLTLICSLLSPAILAELFCAWWNRQQNWALYANVLNCAQWLVLAILTLTLLAVRIAVGFGLPLHNALGLGAIFIALYLLWFHWFVARNALNLSRWRALFVMLAVVFGTALIVQTPALVTGHDPLAASLPPPP